MVWLDWLILAVILISIIMAFFRGASREIIALSAWILGAYCAFIYSPSLQLLLESHIETPEIRYGIVFMAILIIFLILGAIAGMFMGRLVNTIGLTGLDKSLGIVFGLARGLLLVILFIMVASFTPLIKNDLWKSSWFVTQFEGTATELLAWIEHWGLLPEMPEAKNPPQNENNNNTNEQNIEVIDLQ